jgi:hypothetical protein
LQESNTKGIGGSVDMKGLVQVQGSYTTSKAFGFSDAEYGWSRAEVDDYSSTGVPSWSVKWTWALRYWKGGRMAFNHEKPWKFSKGHMPELPFDKKPDQPYLKIDLSNLQENWAEWRSSPQIEGVREIEWDVKVQFFTVKLQKREWSLKQSFKSSFEAEMLGPGEIAEVTKMVTVRH